MNDPLGDKLLLFSHDEIEELTSSLRSINPSLRTKLGMSLAWTQPVSLTRSLKEDLEDQINLWAAYVLREVRRRP